MEMIKHSEKTIVFCAKQEHALEIRNLINQMKTSTEPDYCVRVTADDGARGEQYLRDFQDNEKTIPTILTTSQKLSTGVDARNVRNIVLLRPVTNMIEFKQIIGRGTRLFDGKDYFTVYDFVKAHHLFSDPAWDGEPEELTTGGGKGGGGSGDGEDEGEGGGTTLPPRPTPPPRPPVIEVALSDGSVRRIRSMTSTLFLGADGKPMSAAQFLESLFGNLPEFFKDEDELRSIWCVPDTRKSLLDGLTERGFSKDVLAEMQSIIEAEKSDLFDVLAFVAFAMEPVTREERANKARIEIHGHFNVKQDAFIDFVLAHYVKEGVDELESEKLTPLLKLKYNNAIADAIADLGKPELIKSVFVGFQKYLYQSNAVL
ncbi:type I restriction-modification enzyme R subunit C-terminal domain-containing protein [Pseudomonas sp. T5W1]|uniref:Type I restriction-modification enzyme R subunit C-terminal domain-containing protein n=1 Tax=Pseudomonas spirodelae TaxID=3101751 RepID=A0ABU5PCL6_9PSED|nr:type I restriction-modification enzyme R subunit C-terminal domain-containing protein [Pseudomonas sp. T5W1]MEA1607426.1 type I restriction-modification enzyme R subunit C-terminal domain-containing protein [Pseudomonas sp. T5W1]